MTVCDFFAGLIAGMAGLVAGHPIDTIKVRQQLAGVNMKAAVKNIYRIRGLRGFYRGLTVPMLANGVLNAVYFSVYGWTVDLVVDYREATVEGETSEDVYTEVAVEDINSGAIVEEADDDTEEPDTNVEISKTLNIGHTMTHFKPKGFVSAVGANTHNSIQSEQATIWDCFIGGWVAGWASLLLACPVDVLKGPKGFYRGIIPMSNRNFIGAALNYAVMKFCIDLYPESPKLWYQVVPAASLAGIVSWAFVTPFDVIKTRMQSDNLRKPRFKSMRECADRIVHRQGIRGLFRGLESMALRTFPVNAVTFVVYEWIQSHCHNWHR